MAEIAPAVQGAKVRGDSWEPVTYKLTANTDTISSTLQLTRLFILNGAGAQQVTFQDAAGNEILKTGSIGANASLDFPCTRRQSFNGLKLVTGTCTVYVWGRRFIA